MSATSTGRRGSVGFVFAWALFGGDAATSRAEPDPTAEIDVAAILANDTLNQIAAIEADEHESETPLEVFGFADVGYSRPFWSEKSIYAGSGLDARPYFQVGNLNLYVAKTLASKWRYLSEFRFTFAPNGAPSATTANGLVDTSVPDPADISRPYRYGSIEIERAQIEYELHSMFSVAAGLWLTPYGIWNIDHGSPTVIAIRRPYIVGEQLFPERQTGIQVHGSRHFGNYRFQYHLTASNGRNPVDTTRDTDTDIALGGRVELQWRKASVIKGGASFYRGRYTDRVAAKYNIGTNQTSSPILSQFDEHALGLDLQWDWNRLAVRAEFIYNLKEYDDAHRREINPGQYAPDQQRFGMYALAGYRFNLLGVMPYLLYQDFVPDDGPGVYFVRRFISYHAGLNFRPVPRVVIKVEYYRADFPGALKIVRDAETFHGLDLQLAVAF
jgi:hypothetical protein